MSGLNGSEVSGVFMGAVAGVGEPDVVDETGWLTADGPGSASDEKDGPGADGSWV